MISLLCPKRSMYRLFFLTALFLISTFQIQAQSPMRLGIHAGSSISWSKPDGALSPGFFTVSRAGFEGGLVNTLVLNDRLLLSVAANFSSQVFTLRQTGTPKYTLDARFRTYNLDVPLTIGFTGYIGSLRHREMVGIGLQSTLATGSRLILNGDSTSLLNATTSIAQKTSVYPVLMAGFEIGSTFDNDGGMFFGLTLRYGMQDVFSGSLNTNAFPIQSLKYQGTYLGFGLTYYLPRYSYWFKREFIY